MKSRPVLAKRRCPTETRALLVQAAMTEFNTQGFNGTDTNRIARLAGFAPQTFYRHFTDKISVFVEVYEQWWKAETEEVSRAVSAGVDAAKAATVVMKFHQDWRIFRRSLRNLTVEDERIGKARARARREQISTIVRGLTGDSFAVKAGQLLTVERLCDAAADGELRALGLDDAQMLALVTDAVAACLSPTKRDHAPEVSASVASLG